MDGGQVDRSPTAFLLVGFGFAPLVLGVKLPSFDVVDPNLVLGVLGLVAVFAAILYVRRGADGPPAQFRWLVGLSLVAYVFWLIDLWPSEFKLARISSAARLSGPIGYLLLARAGIAMARTRRDPSVARSWQGCAWVGLPLLLLPSVFFAWRDVSDSPDALRFESHSILVMMGATLVLSLPSVLLLHAVLTTQKAVKAASGRLVRLPLRVLAHPGTAAAIVLLFLTPSLLLVPSAIHFAVTPGFDEFVTRNRSAFSFDLPTGIRVLKRHSGPLYMPNSWIDIQKEEREKKAERIGYDFSFQVTRPNATLLDTTNSLEIKVDPPTYEDFLELRVASEIKAIDPRFRLTMTVFLDHRTAARKDNDAALPTLDFLVRAALLAGTGSPTIETVFVDGLAAVPLVPVELSVGSLSYVWQARGRFELVPSCRDEECVSPRVRYREEQRFDIATEEYSYVMKAALTMNGLTRGPGAQSDFTVKSDIKKRSKETSWNGVPW